MFKSWEGLSTFIFVKEGISANERYGIDFFISYSISDYLLLSPSLSTVVTSLEVIYN